MKSKQIMLLVAVLIAGTAGFLAFTYLSSANKPVVAVATRHVLVAATDIPARAKITAAMLKPEERSVSDVDRDAVATIGSATGYLALTTIPAGAVITRSRIGKLDDAPLPTRLKPGTRALTIAIDSVRGVAGLIEPGDHVDVIAVLKSDTATNDGSKVTTCLHDVLVLAMGTALEQQSNPQATTQDQSATTVTLAVTPKQAELLTLADSVAQLRLALRPPGDKVGKNVDAFNVITHSQQAPAPAPVAAAPPAPRAPVERVVQAAPVATAKPAPRELIVTVIDGDKVVGGGK